MHLSDLPTVEGVSWRRYRDGDYESMVPLLNADLEEGGHDSYVTLADFERGFASMDDFNPARDILIAESPDGVVAYVAVSQRRELSGDQILFHAGRVAPAMKRRGIGAGLLSWAHGRLGEMDDDGGGATVLRTAGVSPSTTEFMARNGYEVTQHEAILIRPNLDDIDEISLPEGITVRSVGKGDLRLIYEAEVEHFKDHWGAGEEEASWWEYFTSDPHQDLSLWQVAFDGDDVIGIVRPFINEEENERFGRKRGYTEDISTRRDWRGTGVASALISRALVAQRDRGMEESALSVHEENPHGAYRLYERHGFELYSRIDTLEKAVR